MTKDGKAEWLMKEGFADYMTTAFVGPFAPPVPIMDKATPSPNPSPDPTTL